MSIFWDTSFLADDLQDGTYTTTTHAIGFIIVPIAAPVATKPAKVMFNARSFCL